MNPDKEAEWLADRMQRVRGHREDLTPAFERVWHAALASQPSAAKPVRRLAFAAAALVLAISMSFHWDSVKRRQVQRMEREYAAMEGALSTYWQPPSDALLAPAAFNPPTDQ